MSIASPGPSLANESAMFQAIKRHWHDFADSEPGHRFEERYRRRRKAEHSRAKPIVGMAAGILLLTVGLFLAVAPGPGILFLVAGAALIAQEWLMVARALDRAEIWLRQAFHRFT